MSFLVLTAFLAFKAPEFPVKVTSDIVYRAAPPKELALDVYEPDGANAPRLRPAVIALHGGGFQKGDKSGDESLGGFCQELAARGFVCASIQYRLESDMAADPADTLRERTRNAAIEDTKEALRWLAAHANAYGVDISRIALAGRSAGAIALRLACSPAGRAIPIRAVLDMSGNMKGALGLMQRGDAPVCIIHGTNDTLTPISEARDVAARAAEVGVPHETYFREGKANGHIKSFALEVDGVTLLDHTVDFFYKYLDLEHIDTPDEVARIAKDLEGASKLELVKLHAGPDGPVPKRVTERLHGYPVLAKTGITEKEKKDIARELPRSIPAGEVMMFHCFFPRHAVRATIGDQQLDLVICFQCSMVYVYRGSEEATVLNINSDVKPLLDRILERAR